ncbi:MAG: phospholipid carrier-dependent glycosyltransferase [Chloroflexota bacterium]
MERKRLDLWLMVGIFALSLALRLAFAANFDGLYGQDPYAYYHFAGDLRSALGNHSALEPFFWPLGYPALLALSFTIFGTTPLTAQAVNILLGALLPPLVYVLARQIGAKRLGALAAGLIVAGCGQAIQSSIVVMADIPALFWATLTAVTLLYYCRADQRRWLVIAALTLALACITRWLYLALIPVWLAALLLTWRGIRWRDSLAAGAAAALVLLPQAAVSVQSPYPVLNHAWVEGWQPGNALSHQFDNADGHFDYAQINALFYAQPFYDAYYLAPLFAPFVLVGIWSMRRQRPKLALLLGWALLPYLFLAGIPYQNIRFALILVPPVALLVGVGLETLFSHPNLVLRSVSLRRSAFAALLIAGLIFTIRADQPIIESFVAHQLSDKNAVQWAILHIPADARLYAFGLTLPLQTYAPFEVHELYNETPDTIAGLQADGKAGYLFVNVWVIAHQWAGRPLEATYDWLRDEVGLEYLDRTGNYILFRIADEYWTPAAGFQRSVG